MMFHPGTHGQKNGFVLIDDLENNLEIGKAAKTLPPSKKMSTGNTIKLISQILGLLSIIVVGVYFRIQFCSQPDIICHGRFGYTRIYR